MPSLFTAAREPKYYFGTGITKVETEGACHLVKISGNFGSAVYGKRFVRSSHWKIPGKSGKCKKVGPFSRLERSERNFAFHPPFSYFTQVPGARQRNLSRAVRKTKWLLSSLHSCTSAQFVFLLPAPNDQRYTGKTVQRSSRYRKHSARKPLWKTGQCKTQTSDQG